MRLKLSLLLVFIITYSWSQSGSTKTFTGNGTFPVPAGVTSIQVQAWGGGGSGGGASGAPLLLGRGAAGGGGGAYASNTLLVTPGTTLNVVVASQTSGTTGAGTAGGNSTITGFESFILAAGGSGGDANNAGGSPVGGIGGTVAASAGTTKFAGVNGGNGNSWNLLGLLLSSGAGGAGAGSGGAGGTAVSGLLLSNAPGNAGSPPGGAGSGAINSASGAAQIGGAGAAGRVIISYSCANFSLTSTTATNVCASAGSTSTITLTGSAASLPIGNYVVTYNRSNPSATALTANLTVSTAGNGTFTAVGLTAAGSSVITITKLTSETCSSNITTNNTASVIVSPASVGGAVTGGTTINSGNTSGLLTLSGHTGSVIKWQSSVSPFTTWTDIANTTTTYTSGALTQTTQFRAVVQSGTCAVVYSAATTVTVEDPPTITVGFVTNSCSDGISAKQTALPYSATTGNPISYSIVWDSSPANPLVAVTNAALPASPILIDVPASTAPGTYTGILTVKNANGSISTGYNISLTVVAIPSITTSGIINPICSSTNLQYATLQFTNPTGNPTSYIIDWDETGEGGLVFQGTTSFSFDTSPNSINTIEIPANTLPGTYTGTLKFTDGQCNGSQPVSITISPATVGGLITGGGTVNSGSTSGLLTLSGYTGSILYWASSVSPYNIWLVIPNTAGTATYISGPLTQTTKFQATVKNGDCFERLSDIATVTVVYPPTVVGLDESAASVCRSATATTTTLSYSGTTGSPTTYSIAWNTLSDFAEVIDAPLTGSPITINVPAGAAAGTYSGVLYVKNADGLESSGYAFTLTVNATPSITTGFVITAATVTESGNSQNTSFSYLASAGNPTSYYIDWDATANAALLADQPSTPQVFASGGGTVNTVVISANAQPGTYSGILYIVNEFCTKSINIGVKINPGVRPTIDLDQSTKNGCIDQTVDINYSATTGSPITYSISWYPITGIAEIIDAPLTESPITIEIPAGTTPGTYSGALSVKNAENLESGSYIFSLIVHESPEIISEGIIATTCESIQSQFSTLVYDSSSGDAIKYSIDWDHVANEASLADVSDASHNFDPNGGTIDVPISANVLPGTYTGTFFIENEFCTSENYPIILKITPGTVAGSVTGGTTITSGSTSGLLTLSGHIGNVLNWESSVSPFTEWIEIVTNDASFTSGPLTETTQFRAVVRRGLCDGLSSTLTTVTVEEPFFRGISSKDNSATGTINLESANNSVVISSSNKVINVDTPNQTIDKVYVFDVSGDLIYKKEKVSDSKLSIDNLRSGNQVLIVKVVLNNSDTETRKVIFK